MAAFAEDLDNFTLELGEALILPSRIAADVVNDPGGEPLACAMRALEMSSAAFQRILMFLNPEAGSSVNYVYRLSRLYDRLSERSALVMLAAWRGSTMAVARAKGKLRGKKPKLSPSQRKHLLTLHAAGEHTQAELAELFNVSRTTIYRELRRTTTDT